MIEVIEKYGKRVASYRELIVWQKSIELVVAIYNLTADFPAQEQYGLTSQMRRAAVSIASNIAEGKTRGTRRDFHHFLTMAFASCAELETQIVIARRLGYGKVEKFGRVDAVFCEVARLLNVFVQKTAS